MKIRRVKKQGELNWRVVKEFDNHEFVTALTDERTGLNAFVAIHNTNLGPALGGTRMMFYSHETKALKDALNLSRAMSYKCALARLPYGGGKGVIMVNDGQPRDETLLSYAHLVHKLGGLFKTGTDVGVSDNDVRLMAQRTSHMLGVVPADRGGLSTSSTAALGVYYAMHAAVKQIFGADELKGAHVAIKGAGKLGEELARLISQSGGKVFISDIDPEKSKNVEEKYPGVTAVNNNAIHKQEVDIYSPCALGNEFNETIVPQLKCRAVVGGANNQLESEEAGDLLHEHGILYSPDYVTNAGGLIYVADELEEGGFNKERVLDRTRYIKETLLEIFDSSAKEQVPTYKVADMMAKFRIESFEQYVD
jgi:leucine dehydrogenase